MYKKPISKKNRPKRIKAGTKKTRPDLRRLVKTKWCQVASCRVSERPVENISSSISIFCALWYVSFLAFRDYATAQWHHTLRLPKVKITNSIINFFYDCVLQIFYLLFGRFSCGVSVFRCSRSCKIQLFNPQH